MFNVIQKSVAGGAALAAVAAMAVPAPAMAQSSYYGDRYDRYERPYDQCRSDRTSRTGSGAIIGGGLGAVAGSQLAARGRRTEGSVLGAVVGGLIGWVASMIMRTDAQQGVFLNIVVGIVGALLAGFRGDTHPAGGACGAGGGHRLAVRGVPPRGGTPGGPKKASQSAR